MPLNKKERGNTPHAEKLASLLLSLLLCLSLLPGQARAENLPNPVDPPIAAEPLDSETLEKPEAPEEPLMPLAETDEFPNGEENGHAN